MHQQLVICANHLDREENSKINLFERVIVEVRRAGCNVTYWYKISHSIATTAENHYSESDAVEMTLHLCVSKRSDFRVTDIPFLFHIALLFHSVPFSLYQILYPLPPFLLHLIPFLLHLS